MRYIVYFCLAVLLLSPLSPASAEISKVRGTRVTMQSPDGFKPAANFSGFNNEALHAAVMVTEMPIPFEIATSGYNETGLASKGIKLVSKEKIDVDGYPGLLIEAKQTAYGSEFIKWISAFGDKTITVLITATFPGTEAEALSKRMKEAVLTARYDAQAKAPDPMEDLPFTVSGTKSLLIAGRVQNTLLLTPTGSMTNVDSKDNSVFVIGQALSDMDVGDKTEFAKRRLQKTDNLTDIQILTEKDVTVGGMPAREILATAKGKQGEPVFVLQTIAFGRGSYFIMQGMTDMSRRISKEYEFRSIVNSLKLKSPAS